MQLILLSPRKSLSKAYLKVKPSRSEIELFKKNLIGLIDGIDESESEEYNKNDLSDFLKNSFYHPRFYINTKERTDLVIHNGSDPKSLPGVLIEAKKPSNKTEMVRPDNLNAKALHELIYYYLRERITNRNLEIKHLIATNIYEWFVFDAVLFEKTFAQDKKLVQQFTDFEERRLAGKSTDFFYQEIAEPFITGLTSELSFTWFDFRDFDKPLRNEDKKDDSKLIALFKLLSPEHLLKLPFANDSNRLDKAFYTELLHIIGLTETKEGSKKLIGRKKEGARDPGSLIENAIIQIDSHDMISRIDKPSRFGETYQERLFNISLDLVITWIDRILFLKLLEAQLIKYHKSDSSYSFLTSDKMKGYDALDSLFFRVLAKKIKERDPAVTKLFEKVPYLNSSLFEPTELEQKTIFISNLQDDCMIPVHPGTVLKNSNGKRSTGTLNGLDYLFAFLDAYDFSSEGAEEIQEENKTLINSSVLGLIFEKINGYKDGSFFTPGFITMYMCRETIRRAVVQKFNDMKGWNCQNLEELYNKIEDKKEANDIINSLKICDPGVGSGHFLVSALNEIIAIKSELKMLSDKEGKRLKEYHVEVANDELIITDEDGKLFEYNPKSPESQRVQETLFHEKQTIIENCLFGVDINPNSVKICRLRLWIELLKNAYYKPESHFTELETLPNIDINIKCGNSLISRYALDDDIRQALKNSKWNIDSYRMAVMTYRNASGKEEKREMERLIESIKNDFETEVAANDKRLLQLKKLNGDLFNLTNQTSLFERSKKELSEWNKKVNDLTAKINKLETELNEIKTNKIYENAFEWRFEFPEVLNDEGEFVGFDVVIGNPPYGVILSKKEFQSLNYIEDSGVSPGFNDSYGLFIVLSLRIILKNNGHLSFIVPNTWRLLEGAEKFRVNLITQNYFFEINQFLERVFPDAVVDCDIISIQKRFTSAYGIQINSFKQNSLVDATIINTKYLLCRHSMNLFLKEPHYELLSKLERQSNLLSNDFFVKNGIKPYEIGKGNPPQTKSILEGKPFTSNVKISEDFKPLIGGSSFNRYLVTWNNDYFIKYGEWLAAPRNPKIFKEEEKLLIRQTSDRVICAIIGKDYIVRNNTHIILKKESAKISLKFLMAILNSKLLDYYYWCMNPERGEALAEVKAFHVESFIYPKVSKESENQFVMIVDQILSLKNSNPLTDTSALEKEIDQMVYELYGLTEDEIKIIEQS
jgi:hypothetical protein